MSQPSFFNRIRQSFRKRYCTPWTPRKQAELHAHRTAYVGYDSGHIRWIELEREEAMNFNGSGMTYFMDLGLSPQAAAKCGEHAAVVDVLNQRLATDATLIGVPRSVVQQQRDTAAQAIADAIARAKS